MAMNGYDNDDVERRGLLFVLSSPSGAGATTLSRLLIERIPGLKMSVSVTTRAMRPGEVDGRDYLFVDKVHFDELVKRHQLLEWATVLDNSYGTPRQTVETALSKSEDVLFNIDWQGAQQLREKARADVVSVFILPPSLRELERRLRSSAQYSHDMIRSRMSYATHEMSHWAEYDYIVINNEIDAAFAELQSILKAERLKRERRIGMSALVRTLDRTVETSSGENSGEDERTDAFQGGAFQGGAFQGAASDATQPQESAFELLQARVAVLEAAVASRPAGMGHNRGPNLHEEPSIDEEEIQTFISRLRDQRATAPVDLPDLINAAQVADPAVNKWRERTDEFAKGVLKGSGFVIGKEVAEKLAQAAWVHSVYSALQGVFESLIHWLNFFR
jgi:guanylate kinase